MKTQPLVFFGFCVAISFASSFSHAAVEPASKETSAMGDSLTTSRKDVAHSFVVPKPVGQVFGLFDPIAEKEWVPGWDPQPVHPAELSLEVASVFHLERGDHKEIWTVLRHDPKMHVAEYLATTPDYQQRWITVECETVEGGTKVNVRYRVTALSDAGRKDLAEFDASYIRAWEAPVAAALGIQ